MMGASQNGGRNDGREGGRREGGLDGNWVLFLYSLSTLPPFPSMSYRIKLLHEGTSYTMPPWGTVLMSLTDWLTTCPLGPAGFAPLWRELSKCLSSHSANLGLFFCCIFFF